MLLDWYGSILIPKTIHVNIYFTFEKLIMKKKQDNLKPPKKCIDEVDWEAIHEKLVDELNHMSIAEVSAKYWINHNTLIHYCKKNNIGQAALNKLKASGLSMRTFDYLNRIHDVLIEELKSMSIREVAKKRNVNFAVLHKYCDDYDIDAPVVYVKDPADKLSKDRVYWEGIHEKLVKQLVKMSVTKVAKKHRLPYPTLYNYCIRMNIPMPSRKPRDYTDGRYIDWEVIHDDIVEDLKTMLMCDVAIKYNLNIDALSKYCARNKIPVPTKKYINWELIHDQIVIDLKTLSIRKVAKKHNIGRSALSVYCRRVNIGQKHRARAKS